MIQHQQQTTKTKIQHQSIYTINSTKITAPINLTPSTSPQSSNYNIPQDVILPGGRLQHFYNNWKKITTHNWPL